MDKHRTEWRPSKWSKKKVIIFQGRDESRWHPLTVWLGYRAGVCGVQPLFDEKLGSVGGRRAVCWVWPLHKVPELSHRQLVCELQLLHGGEHAGQQLDLCELSLSPLHVGHVDGGELKQRPPLLQHSENQSNQTHVVLKWTNQSM